MAATTPTSTTSASGAIAVPVAIRVSPDRLERLSRLVEGALGWPVVEQGDPVLPPVALITDVATAAAVAEAAGRPPDVHARPVPVVLLVAADDDAPTAAVAADGSSAIVRWPPTSDELRLAVDGIAPVRRSRPWCTVVSSAGGVGATTVALALAGLRAWQHGATLAALSGPPHVRGAPVVGPGDLGSPAAWTAAAPVAGLDALRVVGLRPATRGPDGLSSDPVPSTADVPVVADLGVVESLDVLSDVLVVRPDRAGHDAVEVSPARFVVAVGPGDVPRRELTAAAGPRGLVELRRDARVRRACHAGRHPTDAPGAWLRPLAPLVTALEAGE